MDAMDTTFITIHDLQPEAHILYVSDSIVDILGYNPEEIDGRSCWDFFHPQEIPIARAKHGRSIQMDKAAVLSYCRMKHADGNWVGCEVVFTVVYDCLVGCTSIYKRGLRAQSRASEAPAIRRLFSAAHPVDPRYHMLSHLSTKFTMMPQQAVMREPRAALFLNRYTRTQLIMYATGGLAEVLGIAGEELRGKSFYYCIHRNCLRDAIRCLENAKANDSIAYLRFWWRDPREDGVDEEVEQAVEDSSEDSDAISPSQSEQSPGQSLSPEISRVEPADARAPPPLRASSSSGLENHNHPNSHESIFGEPRDEQQNTSGSNTSGSAGRQSRSPSQPIELEAVVSCTSDGLVVCLRRAAPLPTQHPTPYDAQERPIQVGLRRLPDNAPDSSYMGHDATMTGIAPRAATGQLSHGPVDRQSAYAAPQPRHTSSGYATGLFASPWSVPAVVPPQHEQARFQPASGFAHSGHNRDLYPASTVNQQDFMNSIKEMAVFAWALVGINGSLADNAYGKPFGESQPPGGVQIWQPDGNVPLAEDGCVADHAVPQDRYSEVQPRTGGGDHRCLTSEQVGNTIAPYGVVSPPADSAIDRKFSGFGKAPLVSETSVDGRMIDGDAGINSQRKLPGFEGFQHPKQASPGTGTMLDYSQMVDGVDSPPGLDRHSTTSSDRTTGHTSNNYGFGDPGLSSKGRK